MNGIILFVTIICFFALLTGCVIVEFRDSRAIKNPPVPKPIEPPEQKSIAQYSRKREEMFPPFNRKLFLELMRTYNESHFVYDLAKNICDLYEKTENIDIIAALETIADNHVTPVWEAYNRGGDLSTMKYQISLIQKNVDRLWQVQRGESTNEQQVMTIFLEAIDRELNPPPSALDLNKKTD